MVIVILPWRPQPTRLAAFESVVDWYRWNLPEAEIRTVDSEDEVFNLARCRNLGVRSAARETGADEVVVINDADTIPERAALLEAIEAAATSGLVHLPYSEYHWLGPVGSEQFRSGTALPECTFDLVIGACSGVYVTTATSWWSHGGQDERFRGWGFEDAAWYLAHETLLGEAPRRHAGRVFALDHQQQSREGMQYDANAGLMERYRVAAASIEAMRQFLFAEAETDAEAEADADAPAETPEPTADSARERPGD